MDDEPKMPDSRREYARQYYHRNKERIRAQSDRRKKRRNANQKRYYQNNKEKVRARNEAYRLRTRDKRNERERMKRAECPEFAQAERERHVRRYTTNRRYRLRVLATNAKLRGKTCGMAVDLSCFEPFLASPPVCCACCGHELDYEHRQTRYSPSIDRIRNERGYVTGNVAIICFRCNSLKKDGTESDFVQILDYMRRLTSYGDS